MDNIGFTPEESAEQVRRHAFALFQSGHTDMLLQAIGVPLLEELHIEAARAQLSRLVITSDYRFLLPEYGKEVELSPVHKAVYLLFLNHPEGIEFKRLSEYRNELYHLYKETSCTTSESRIADGVAHLTNPLDNAINEKCSRIKHAFTDIMDQYKASYYIISSHVAQHMAGTGRIWYRRQKLIKLPRELVVYQNDIL